MKIGLISDAHLGYTSGQFKVKGAGYNVREWDGIQAFNQAIDQIIAEGDIDIVLIPGDLFHSQSPKNHILIEAQSGLRRLAATGITTHIIAGNHDATDIKSDIPANLIVHEPNNNIFSYVEPYLKLEIHPGLVAHFLSHHAYIEQADTMKDIKLEEGKVNILVTHGSCYDTNLGVILDNPGEPREVIIPEEIMDMPWDFTFMGHIHERGFVASGDGGVTDTSKRKQFYGGSLVRRGFSDKECALGRGWTKWEVDGNNFTPTYFQVAQRPQFDMIPIDAVNMDAVEVSTAIVEQLKAVIEAVEKMSGEIDFHNRPIIRQTIKGITPFNRMGISSSLITEYKAKCLTHTFKIIRTDEEVDPSSNVTVEALKSRDIVAIFKQWKEESNIKLQEDIHDSVIRRAESFLVLSRDNYEEE